MRIPIALACALLCGACVHEGETVRFQAKPTQQAIMRDGQPALISQKKSSLVMIRPALRQFASGGRPVFVVAMRNVGKKPLEFRVADVAVTQAAGNAGVPMPVLRYEELVAEAKSQQVAAMVLTGIVVGANTAAASQEGYRTRTTTVDSPTGSYSYQTTTFSRSRAIAAQNRATRENQRLIDGVMDVGDATFAMLEREVIKDNTLMPGEWYGGTIYLQPPAQADGANGAKSYTIALTLGPERHEITLVQEGVR